MITANVDSSLRVVAAIIWFLVFSALTPLVSAADATPGKPPYNVAYFDAGLGGFIPSSSSASVPTQDCTKLGFLVPGKRCAEAFNGTPTANFGGGVRPIRYLQAGFTTSLLLADFAGFGTKSAQYQCTSGCTGTVTRDITAHSFLFTTDARAVIPLFRDRMTISAGGGMAWMTVDQQADKVGNEQLQGCINCQSRSGHGPTEVVEVMFLPTREKGSFEMGFGFHYRMVQITTSGISARGGLTAADPYGAYIPFSAGVTYKDHFSSFGGTFTFRFGRRR